MYQCTEPGVGYFLGITLKTTITIKFYIYELILYTDVASFCRNYLDNYERKNSNLII